MDWNNKLQPKKMKNPTVSEILGGRQEKVFIQSVDEIPQIAKEYVDYFHNEDDEQQKNFVYKINLDNALRDFEKRGYFSFPRSDKTFYIK